MGYTKIEGIAGFVTIEKAADLFGLTIDGVHKLVKRHNVPCLKLGSSFLLRPADVALHRRVDSSQTVRP